MAHKAVGFISGIGDDELISAPGVGSRLKITSVYLTSTGVAAWYLRSGSSGTFHIGNATQGAHIAASNSFNLEKSFLCDENAPLVLTRITDDTMSGIITYEIVKVSDAG